MKVLYTFLLCLPFLTNAQGKYFVYLKDKTGSLYTIERPLEFLSQKSLDRRLSQNITLSSKDLPVSQTYIQTLKNKGFKILGKSKWLNAVLVEGHKDSLNLLTFVDKIEGDSDIRGNHVNLRGAKVKQKLTSPVEPINYGHALTQIKMLGVDTMHQNGYMGQNVLIAVMDAGFPNVNTASGFNTLRPNIIKTFNYVTNNTDIYRDNTHGTNVLSIMASYLPGQTVGPAPMASFALYTTEDNDSESKLEEVNWVLAAENADSLGVDIISSSLGYSEFDDPNQNYTYQDMDGKTSIIVKAANQAIENGILVVISAGNEGNTPWKYISTPADGKKVISVAAVNNNKLIAGFSSFGPSGDGRLKPEISAMGVSTVYNNNGSNINGGNGTSYSAPLISGFLAGIKSQFPTLTSDQIREILYKSADRYANPNYSYGYGIPSYSKFVQIANQEYLVLGECKTCWDLKVYPNPIFNTERLNITIDSAPLESSVLVSVYTSSGQKFVEDSLYGNLDLSGLKSGLYILRFKKSGTTYSRRFYIK